MRVQYLEAMGVNIWRLRDNEASMFSQCFHYRLLDKRQQMLGLLLADAGAATEQASEQQRNLLEAICKAITLSGEGEIIELNDSFSSELMQTRQQARFVILMGLQSANYFLRTDSSLEDLSLEELRSNRKVAQDGNENPKTIVTYSLATLLAKPHLKAQAWQDLRNILFCIA